MLEICEPQIWIPQGEQERTSDICKVWLKRPKPHGRVPQRNQMRTIPYFQEYGIYTKDREVKYR